MKKNNKHFGLLIIMSTFILLSVLSCTDKFDEYNMDKNSSITISSKQYSAMFTASLRYGLEWYMGDMHPMSSAVTLHSCGYVVCGFPQLDMYSLRANWVESAFKAIYTTALPPCMAIISVADKNNDVLQKNVALIWKVYLAQILTDTFGPIPYTEACSGAASVAYESQEAVYDHMFDDMDKAITALMAELQKNPKANVFGDGDVIFKGDVAQWVKFGNSIRLRMALRISNIKPEKAKAEAEKAVKTGMFLLDNNADKMVFPNNNSRFDNDNGYARIDSYGELVMSNSMESFMVGFKDPRLSAYWSPVKEGIDPKTEFSYGWSVSDHPYWAYKLGTYHGMASGTLHAKGDPCYISNSRMGPSMSGAQGKRNDPLATIPVYNSAETWFLLAEGAWRGWNMNGTAQEFYEKGIEVSIKQWEAGNDSDIQQYIHSNSVPAATEYIYGDKDDSGNLIYRTEVDPATTNIPVKFSNNRDIQYEQIITQKWLANFPLSVEAWADYRRTRLPKIYPKKSSVNQNIDLSKGMIMTRLPFVDSEKAANVEEIKKAVQLLGGPDLESTPLWWDIHKNGN